MSSFHLYDIQRKSGLFVRKFGSNGAIDLQENNPDADDLAASIWDYEDKQLYVYPSDGGEVMYVSSDSTADTTVSITIEGLDENFEEKSQTITLTGTTPIQLDGLWTRIQRAFNGGASDLAGNVYIYTTGDETDGVPNTPANVKGHIENQHQQTRQAFYTVPKGKQFNVSGYHVSCDAKTNNTDVNLTIAFQVRYFGGVFRTQEIIAVSNKSPSIVKVDMPFPLPSKTDVRPLVISSSANGVKVHCVFEGILL